MGVILKDVDCPKCDSAASVELIRADDKGQKWAYCQSCSATLLLDPKNRVLHVGT